MLRSTLVVALVATSCLAAADFAGRWAGTIETNGSRTPIYLTLTQQDGRITGTVATGSDTQPTPIGKAELRNDELAFEVQDNAGRVTRFRLTLTGGVLGGEATVGTQISRISIVAFSGGSGDRAGTGIGSGGGVGAGGGSGVGVPGGVFRVGGGVSAPVLIQKVDPEYTEEARAAKYQGTVLLHMEVAPDGTPRNIKVQRSLGMGLDEKAIEAVKQWKFRPGL